MGSGSYQSTNPYQTPNSIDMLHSSEALGDKIQCREGNNPDLQLRPLNFY